MNKIAAFIIIGDEILSGRTKDKNLNFLANELIDLGIDLNEVRVIKDNHQAIIATVNELKAKYDYVFTSGGIGPTHDDITSESMGGTCCEVSRTLTLEQAAVGITHQIPTVSAV